MIVETHVTVSHRYYMNKRKGDLIERVRLLQGFVGDTVDHPQTLAAQMSKEQLATYAMTLHRRLPS